MPELAAARYVTEAITPENAEWTCLTPWERNRIVARATWMIMTEKKIRWGEAIREAWGLVRFRCMQVGAPF